MPSSSTPTKMKVICGTMSMGAPGTMGYPHVHTAVEVSKIFDAFQKHGHNELDTARAYGTGTTEELLAKTNYAARGLLMDTKLFPSAGHPLEQKDTCYTHAPVDVRRGLRDSLTALKADAVEVFFLHGPDRKHPYEDTLRALDELCREGKFKRWGVSNYMAWEVAQMCEICERHGWVKPSVYEGHYHALMRLVEGELFPCLRKYGMSFYVYSPLASGFLTGRYERGQEIDNFHLRHLWNDQYFDALDILKPAAEKHGLTISEMALRWLVHHSQLKAELGDGIILGAGSVKNLERNLDDTEKGRLPDDVVVAMDDAWIACKAKAGKYWF